MVSYLPARLRFCLLLTALHFGLFGLFRLAFWLVFRNPAVAVSGSDLARAWYLGTKFDLRLAAWLCIPFLLLSWLPGLNPVRKPAAARLWVYVYSALVTAICLIYFMDFGYFAYLQSRIRMEILDHIAEPAIAARMVWESYPVIWALAGLVVLVVLYAWLLHRAARPALRPSAGPVRWMPRIVASVLGVLLAAGAIYGNVAWYPLRWSEAYFSPDPLVSALALNPVLFLLDTLPSREDVPSAEEIRPYMGILAEHYGMARRNPDDLRLCRVVPTRRTWERPPNIVLIHLESFAAFKTGLMGNDLAATPEFDRLARESLFFPNFFVPRPPSARSVFTTFTGIPDLHEPGYASHNPALVRQRSLVNALTGYGKFYFIGGSASWANIRGFLSQSVPGLRIYEESDYDAPHMDVWGVSDLDLVRETHRVLARQPQPFFAFIQTAGNHRPYTIPEDRGDFRELTIDEAAARQAGFDSAAAVNGLRWLDYAVGEFFRLARTAPYYDNTLFCLYGDHGSPSTIDTPFEQLGLTSHHVPMIIHAPHLLGPGRVEERLMGSPDLLPTLLSLAGVPYVNETLGRDILAVESPDRQFVPIDHWQYIGLLTPRFYLTLSPVLGHRLLAYRTETPLRDIGPEHPDEARRLERLCRALNLYARYLIHYNRPE
ncbi:MAG: LTA synthase family protein [Acidobacteria bacterium]|nr:LTA synthase family protein [Acidobacteriota bacterium]